VLQRKQQQQQQQAVTQQCISKQLHLQQQHPWQPLMGTQ
jgi:hypothetical protein